MTAVANSSNNPVGIPTLRPMDPVVCKGANFINVGSVHQNSFLCNIPHKGYSVIIQGTHRSALALPFIPKYAITRVLKDDWEYILQQPQYKNHPHFKSGRIFAEKNEYETIKKAEDSEMQALAQHSTTAQLTSDDMNKPDRQGVADLTVNLQPIQNG